MIDKLRLAADPIYRKTVETLMALVPLKEMIRAFLPAAEKMAPKFDINNAFLVWLDSKITELIDGDRKLRKGTESMFCPAQKISLGILAADPVYLDSAKAFVALLRSGPVPFTESERKWIKGHYGVEVV